METTHYVLRLKGSGGKFVSRLPHDFDESNFIDGWENAHKGLTYDTLEGAEATLSYMPEDEAASLMIEEIEMEPRERPEPLPTDGPEPGTYAYTARFLADSGIMSGDEADRWKDEMKERDL